MKWTEKEEILLREKFPEELKTAEIVVTYKTATWNDGGSYIDTVWDAGDTLWKTRYSDWSPRHAEISKVIRVEKTETTVTYEPA